MDKNGWRKVNFLQTVDSKSNNNDNSISLKWLSIRLPSWVIIITGYGHAPLPGQAQQQQHSTSCPLLLHSHTLFHIHILFHTLLIRCYSPHTNTLPFPILNNLLVHPFFLQTRSPFSILFYFIFLFSSLFSLSPAFSGLIWLFVHLFTFNIFLKKNHVGLLRWVGLEIRWMSWCLEMTLEKLGKSF